MFTQYIAIWLSYTGDYRSYIPKKYRVVNLAIFYVHILYIYIYIYIYTYLRWTSLNIDWFTINWMTLNIDSDSNIIHWVIPRLPLAGPESRAAAAQSRTPPIALPKGNSWPNLVVPCYNGQLVMLSCGDHVYINIYTYTPIWHDTHSYYIMLYHI